MTGEEQGLELGDNVDVPGDMHGIVKFIGSVKGKKGQFIGVELSREFAARGKNDGDVDGIIYKRAGLSAVVYYTSLDTLSHVIREHGEQRLIWHSVRYFTTSVPGSGIFLPIHRALKRASPTPTSGSFPPTPTTPSYTNFNVASKGPLADAYTPPLPPVPKLFSQSVGPGARAPSPQFKPRSRPSLPRPESPLRKQPTLAPTPGRVSSLTPRGGVVASRFPSNGPAPSKSATPKARTPAPPRPYSRNNSRLGHRTDVVDEGSWSTPIGIGRTSDVSKSTFNLRASVRPLSRQAGSYEGSNEMQRLKMQLEERETQLRTLLREKNDRISTLTAEFDAHRADFRSTIDTLEMASTETERVYEKRVEDLLAEVRELQEGRDDFESVAQQLKQLEELVQELEEGLEDARRGEAEARGEVEFLRGEVERGRSELRREREKAAEAAKGADGTVRENEQRDEELNRMRETLEQLEHERNELQDLVEEKAAREAELELELERVQKNERRTSVTSDGVPAYMPSRESKGAIKNWQASLSLKGSHANSVKQDTAPESEARSTTANGDSLRCEVCQSGGHDILTCTNMFGEHSQGSARTAANGKHMEMGSAASQSRDHPTPSPEAHDSPSAPKTVSPLKKTASSGSAPAKPVPTPQDDDKWCALCEKDGHLAFDCPDEANF
ncbi:hypothetical protein LTR16_003942 [Cryomyces antarcticus]|uniref:CAP-Gly domain-containing protein n=1 Tax=Cryomyces antarcticus TaxID=329879 RepID=A0ABR0LXL4_9PEZI|nr:hypothetical protein LTR16_003942 [Cryomyces antarcticus]